MNQKKAFILTGTLIALIAIIFSFSWFSIKDANNKKKLENQIDRYLARIEKYPEEAENYRVVSKLYENIGDLNLSDQYYEFYQEIKKIKEQKDDQKKETFLKKQLKLLKSTRANKKVNSTAKTSKPFTPGQQEDIIKNIKVDKGDIKFQKAIKIFKQGYLEYLKENYDVAKEKFREAIEEKRDFAKPHAYLAASIFEQKKDIEKARAHIQASLTLNEKEDKAYETLGDISKHLNDYLESEKQYQKAVNFNPQNYLAYYKLGNLKYLEKNFDQATKFYQKSLGLKPSFHKSYLNLSLSFLRLKYLNKAKEYLNKSLEITSLYEDQNRLQKTYSTLAYIYYLNKLYSKSINYYKKSIDLKKNHHDYFHLGLVYEKKNDLKEAKKAYKISIQINENYGKAKFNLATIYLNEKKYSEALKLFNQVTIIEPKLVVNYINAGKCYAAIGQDEKAYEQFKRALSLNENLPTASIEIAKYWKKKGVMDKAIDYAKDALNKESINEDKIIYLNELGLIYKNFSLYNQAEQSFKQAIDIDPVSIPTLENLASLYLIQKLSDEAIAIYKNIIKIDRQNVKTYFALGKSLAKQGKIGEAKEKFRYIKVNFPSFDKIDEVHELLKKL